MTRNAIIRSTGSGYAPCVLRHHSPRSRVQFQQWDKATGAMSTVVGRVVAHGPGRTLTIHTDTGETVTTSCGHVIAERSAS